MNRTWIRKDYDNGDCIAVARLDENGCLVAATRREFAKFSKARRLAKKQKKTAKLLCITAGWDHVLQEA